MALEIQVRPRRVRSVCVHTMTDDKEDRFIFSKDEGFRIGIAGLRVGKIKEGLVIYYGDTYEVFPWNTITKVFINT